MCIRDRYVAFEQLKEKLLREGLFDKDVKKTLPRYPRRIALVTSPTGAAVRDMIRVLGRRFPACEVLVCPVKVQGEGAAQEIAAMLAYVDQHHLADVIITGRGGGSIEDLWAFNEEVVARAIFACQTPVISAVGHEPDVTIADLSLIHISARCSSVCCETAKAFCPPSNCSCPSCGILT